MNVREWFERITSPEELSKVIPQYNLERDIFKEYFAEDEDPDFFDFYGA